MDMLLQKLMYTTKIPEPLDIPGSLTNSKRPRQKRKNKETKESSKPKYHPPRQETKEAPSNQSQEEVVITEPNNKRQKTEKEKSSQQQYNPPQEISEELELPIDQTEEEEITHQLRRSKRVPRVLAKYLESIRAKLQDSENE